MFWTISYVYDFKVAVYLVVASKCAFNDNFIVTQNLVWNHVDLCEDPEGQDHRNRSRAQ